MTSPGTPDWQRKTQWRSNNLFGSVTAGLPSGDTVTGLKPLTSWDAIAIRVSSSDNAGYVLLEWYADDSTTYLLDSHQWYIDSHTQLSVTVPTRAPYVRITTHNNGSTTMHVTRFAAGINSSPGRIDYPVTNNFVQAYQQSLAAGAAITLYLPFIQPGPAWFYYHELDGSSKLEPRIHAVTADGSSTWELYPVDTANNPILQNLILPPTRVTIYIQNPDTASHTYSCALIPSEQ